MPHVLRSEMLITAAQIRNMSVTPMVLANQHGPTTAIIPIQIMGFPRFTVGFGGATNFQVRIGDLVVGTTGDVVGNLTENRVLNIVNDSGIYGLGGHLVAQWVNQPMRLWAGSEVTGGVGQLLVVSLFQIIYPR